MSKTKVLNVRIDPDLKKKAKKLADADGRSLSNWVTKLISTRVKKAEKAERAEKAGKAVKAQQEATDRDQGASS